MKRLIVSFLIIYNCNLLAAARPGSAPIPATRTGSAPSVTPRTGLGGVAVPGRPGAAPTPATRISSAPSVTPRVGLRGVAVPGRPGAAPTPTRTLYPTPPAELRGVAVPERPGAGITPTRNEDILQFAQEQQQLAEEFRRARRNGQGLLRLPTRGGRSGVTGLDPATSSTPPVDTTPTAPAPASTTPAPVTPSTAPPIRPRTTIPAASTDHHILDIINNTENALTLYIQDTIGQRHEINIDETSILSSVEVPNNTQSITSANGMSNTISLTNGVVGVAVNEDPTGENTYRMTSFVPTYEQYVLVYNQSTVQQLVILNISVPSEGLSAYLPGFLGGGQTFNISKQIEPQEVALLEIPQITTNIDEHNTPTVVTPTSVNLSVPSSNDSNAYTLNLTGHNSFVVTPSNNLILSN